MVVERFAQQRFEIGFDLRSELKAKVRRNGLDDLIEKLDNTIKEGIFNFNHNIDVSLVISGLYLEGIDVQLELRSEALQHLHNIAE